MGHRLLDNAVIAKEEYLLLCITQQQCAGSPGGLNEGRRKRAGALMGQWAECPGHGIHRQRGYTIPFEADHQRKEAAEKRALPPGAATTTKKNVKAAAGSHTAPVRPLIECGLAHEKQNAVLITAAAAGFAAKYTAVG